MVPVYATVHISVGQSARVYSLLMSRVLGESKRGTVEVKILELLWCPGRYLLTTLGDLHLRDVEKRDAEHEYRYENNSAKIL